MIHAATDNPHPHPYRFEIVPTHKDHVRVGDVIQEDGRHRTLCRRDFGRCQLMGLTIRGNSYRLGRDLVPVVRIFHAMPPSTAPKLQTCPARCTHGKGLACPVCWPKVAQ